MIGIEWWGALLALGVVVGLLAGLFGIGGGTLLVPMLTLFFLHHGMVETAALHLALGSSMASIVAVACASAWSHYRLRNVRWSLLRFLAPGVAAGTAFGALLAPRLPVSVLVIVFALFVAVVALRMWQGDERRRKPEGGSLPGDLLLLLAGNGIGFLSALVSIGGGSMVVPLLVHYGIAMREAIGTSAVLGVVISLVGTLGYGMAYSAPLAGATGAIYLPAVLLIALGSMVTAPLGAVMGKKMSVRLLRRSFALLLMLLCMLMVWRLV